MQVSCPLGPLWKGIWGYTLLEESQGCVTGTVVLSRILIKHLFQFLLRLLCLPCKTQGWVHGTLDTHPGH
jgi:hypothetical protein